MVVNEKNFNIRKSNLVIKIVYSEVRKIKSKIIKLSLYFLYKHLTIFLK